MNKKFKKLELPDGDKRDPVNKKIAKLNLELIEKIYIRGDMSGHREMAKLTGKDDGTIISENLSSVLYCTHRLKRPVLNIYITKEFEDFLFSSFCNIDINENFSGISHVVDEARKLKLNKFNIVKLIFEDGCRCPTFMFCALRPDEIGGFNISPNAIMYGYYGIWSDVRRRDENVTNFYSYLSLFLSEFDNELVEIDAGFAQNQNHQKGKKLTIRGSSEVMEDIENARSPHFRRGHYRKLSSDRYKKKGIIFVKGCFVKGKAKQFKGDCVE